VKLKLGEEKLEMMTKQEFPNCTAPKISELLELQTESHLLGEMQWRWH
jgi:hypothetical protein